MNILHHKSWHVRTKKNIERVRRDEEKAAEEEKEKLRKIALAEQEARTDLLRSRAKGRLTDKDHGREIESASTSKQIITTTSTDKPSNINFFKEIEDGLRKQGINEEHAKEKRAEKEKWEKSIGLLTYLGKSNIEEQNETPWYITGRNRKRKLEEEEEDDDKGNHKRIKSEKDSKEDRKKADLDPLIRMREYVEKKKKKKKHKDHKEKKHKRKDKEKDRKHKTNLPIPSTSKTIEQLRAERLKRESKEKQKAMQLFADLKGDNSKNSDSGEEEVPERQRKYNSQYNPELSRKYTKRSYDDVRS